MELLESKTKPANYKFGKVLSSINVGMGASHIEHFNVVSMRKMIQYLSNLKKEGTISEEQFTELLVGVCANFVENEVDQRVSKYLNRNLFMLFS